MEIQRFNTLNIQYLEHYLITNMEKKGTRMAFGEVQLQEQYSVTGGYELRFLKMEFEGDSGSYV